MNSSSSASVRWRFVAPALALSLAGLASCSAPAPGSDPPVLLVDRCTASEALYAVGDKLEVGHWDQTWGWRLDELGPHAALKTICPLSSYSERTAPEVAAPKPRIRANSGTKS